MIEPGGRFVQEQQLRLAGEGTGEFHALATPEGEHTHRQVRDRRQVEHPEQTRGPLVQQTFLATDGRQAQRVGNKPAAAAAMATNQDVFAHRHGLEQGEILKRPTDPKTGKAMARQLQQTFACEVNSAGAGLVEAAQTIEECRLAGPVRADQQGQCLAMGMWFSEREKNLFAEHLRRDFLSSRAWVRLCDCPTATNKRY